MCKMTVKKVGDMLQLSWQTATDWGHGIKMHRALMNRKSKARATILSCVDILQEKWSQSVYCPLNKIKLNNKATHVIYYNVCLLHKAEISAAWILAAWWGPFSRKVGGKDPKSVFAWEIDAGEGHAYVDYTGHQLNYSTDRQVTQNPAHHAAPLAHSPCTAPILYKTLVMNNPQFP